MAEDRERDAESGPLHDWVNQAAGRQPGPDAVGVVLARAGLGKTAFLIQLAIDELLAGGEVFHAAVGKELVQVEARYDDLLAARLAGSGGAARRQAHHAVLQRRTIQALEAGQLDPARLAAALDAYRRHLELRPQLVVVDSAEPAQAAAVLPALAELAERVAARIWLAVRTHRTDGDGLAQLGAPRRMPELAIELEPDRDRVSARLVWAHGQPCPNAPGLLLEPGPMLPLGRTASAGANPAAHTLLSGAAPGAEACFGTCAERWSMPERNFSFAGRQPARERGLVELSDEELQLGDVSWTYLTARLGRELSRSPEMRRVLQSIWHQVNPAGEVFAVGRVLPAGTIKGGTGWAVELAKQQRKPVWVFDQQTDCWYEWFTHDWRACNPPLIQQSRFCGTGTRHLDHRGRQAIESLFERSFGPSPGASC